MGSYVPFRNGRIYVSRKGKGPAVVLLHGFLESHHIWDHYASHLEKRFSVIAFDLPGHGKSDCFGYVHSMEMMAECVKAVIESFRIRKCKIVGHSMGGYVAMAFADLYPDHLKGVCLFHSSARSDTRQKKKERDQAIVLVKQNHRSFIRKAIPLLFTPANRKQYRKEIADLKKEALKTPKQGVIAALEGMKKRINREIVLKFSPSPYLFIIGEKDPVIDLKAATAQAKLPQASTSYVAPSAGHMGFIEAREELLPVLLKFLKR